MDLSLLSSALSLNNAGVDSLEVGDFEGALASFSKAMAQSNAFLAQADQVDDDSESTQEDYVHLERARLRVVSSCRAPSSAIHRNHSIYHDLDEQRKFIPSNAIKVMAPTGNDSIKQDPMAVTYCTSATILYNIALTLHAKGTAKHTQDQSDQKSLAKAQKFYLRAWSILSDAGVSSVSTGHALVDILAMSIFNCLAMSSLQLCRCGDCRSYTSSLIGFALTVQPDHHYQAPVDGEDDGTSAILEEHKAFFLANALTWSPPTVAAAA